MPRIREATVGFRRVVGLHGDLDREHVAVLGEALQAARKSGEREIWIDLSDVGALDPSAPRMLLDAHRALERDHRHLAVICPQGPVRRVLGRSALAVFPSRADAHLLS